MGNRSKYSDLGLVPIASTESFQTYGKNGKDPHPVHGATTSNDNPRLDDKDSMSLGVDIQNEWKCWIHGDGRGALQLIAVLRGIRDYRNAAGVMQDPEDALQACLTACNEYGQSG